MSRVIDLPSGAKIEVRPLTGKESKILSDKDAIKSGMFLDKILNACTVGVLDFGPYPQGDKFDWGKALVGDRFYGLLQIRVISLGEEYWFKLQCSASECRERFDYCIDLVKDLPVQRLSEEGKKTFAAGNSFQTVDANGKTVSYRLPTGQDEIASAKFNAFDSAFIQALSQRIVSIEDVSDKRSYLEACAWADLLKLLDAFDANNCGVNTDIEIVCPYCGAIQDVRLPFERGFLLPSYKSSRKVQSENS